MHQVVPVGTFIQEEGGRGNVTVVQSSKDRRASEWCRLQINIVRSLKEFPHARMSHCSECCRSHARGPSWFRRHVARMFQSFEEVLTVVLGSQSTQRGMVSISGELAASLYDVASVIREAQSSIELDLSLAGMLDLRFSQSREEI